MCQVWARLLDACSRGRVCFYFPRKVPGIFPESRPGARTGSSGSGRLCPAGPEADSAPCVWQAGQAAGAERQGWVPGHGGGSSRIARPCSPSHMLQSWVRVERALLGSPRPRAAPSVKELLLESRGASGGLTPETDFKPPGSSAGAGSREETVSSSMDGQSQANCTGLNTIKHHKPTSSPVPAPLPGASPGPPSAPGRSTVQPHLRLGGPTELHRLTPRSWLCPLPRAPAHSRRTRARLLPALPHLT